MSKQSIGKGNPGARPANAAGESPNRGAANSKPGSSIPAAPKNNAPVRPGARAGAAPARTNTKLATGARLPAKKSGFRLRPLDIALLVAGVLVIAFIVMSAIQAPPQRLDASAQITANGTPLPTSGSAPDFSLPAIDGQTYSLSSFKGKPVVLEFMATWCPHCQDDAPTMNQLDAAYKSKGVQLLAINATPYGHDHTSPAQMDDLKWFQSNYSVTFPMLFDKALKSANDYQVVSYPTIYVIGKDGKVAFPPPTDSIPDLATLSSELDKILAQ